MERKILNFFQEIEKLKSTLRHNWTRTGRQESSAEHTWRATLLLLVLQDTFKIKVDILKAVKMLLIHDIPELIDGDIPGFIKKEAHYQQELMHAKKVFSLLPKPLYKEYYQLFIEFEKAKSLEARLAYTVDRIESQLQHLDSGSRYWGAEEFSQLLNWPNNIIKKLGNKDIKEFWQLIKKDLQKEKRKHRKKR